MHIKQFQRGGRGVFSCESCGHRTRQTGDSEHLCEDCYELAGLENGVADGHPVADYLTEAVERYKRIVARGRDYDFWTALGEAVHAEIAKS